MLVQIAALPIVRRGAGERERILARQHLEQNLEGIDYDFELCITESHDVVAGILGEAEGYDLIVTDSQTLIMLSMRVRAP